MVNGTRAPALPRITIVTISLDQGRYLEACLRSVLEQDYPALEYIVVDAGSRDGSRELLARYAARLSRLVLEPDEGPADGLNKGFAQATGEVYGYLNADDLLLPGALARVGGWFRAAPRADVIYADGVRIDAEGRTLSRMFSTRWSLDGYIHGATNTVQPSTFVRAQAFREAGGFNAANRTCWDGELLVDLALHGARFERRRGPVAAFRTHPASITGSGRLARETTRDFDRLFRKVRGRDRRAIDRALAPLYRLWKIATHPGVSAAKLRDRIAPARMPARR